MKSPPSFAIRPITAETARPLRQAILRPHQSVDEMVFPGDDDPVTGHFGAFVGDKLVGIVSLYAVAPPSLLPQPAWQLRMMGVLPKYQHLGAGRALVQACVTHARHHDGQTLWCNARIKAVPFYTRLGFQILGEAFELPGIGLHHFMHRAP